MKNHNDATMPGATNRDRIPMRLLGAMLCLGTGLAHAEPVRVHALPLSELEVPIQYSAPATVVSLNETQISAELAARIVDIMVLEGDIVPQGATLVRLDCRDYDLGLQRAQGDLTALLAREKLARQQLKRAESLARTKNISQELLDQRRTEIEAASAEVAAQRAT
ncbi:MAG: biotin/lipoyl-binding protein, partial [Gammaproteobacteria bacterium]|nr:biotin/lipoyl-binding protein [Gammaproteobacteria bacterium]